MINGGRPRIPSGPWLSRNRNCRAASVRWQWILWQLLPQVLKNRYRVGLADASYHLDQIGHPERWRSNMDDSVAVEFHLWSDPPGPIGFRVTPQQATLPGEPPYDTVSLCDQVYGALV